MSISPLRSLSWAADPWDALVEREVAHQRDIEAAFDRADACERLGDLRHALDWLDRACELSGGLSPECCAQRARLARQLGDGTPLTGPRSNLAGRGAAAPADGHAFDGASRPCVGFEVEAER